MPIVSRVVDYPAHSRFELATPEGIAFALYRDGPGSIVITHTEVPRSLRGQGIGSELVRGTLDTIRARGLKVTPRCGFVLRFLSEHPEYRDMVA